MLKQGKRERHFAATGRLRLPDRVTAWWGGFARRWSVHADLTRVCLLALIVLVSLDALSAVADAAATLLREAGAAIDPAILHALRLDTEYGVWSVLGYAKLVCVTLLAAAISIRTGIRSYVVLAMIFLFLAADDALLIHERFAELLAGMVDLSGFGGISPGHVGELIYFAAVGPLVLAGLAVASFRAPPSHKVNVWILAFLVLAIGFFAVGIDFIDQIVAEFSRAGSKLMSLLEDAGENVVVSLAIVFLMMIRERVIREA